MSKNGVKMWFLFPDLPYPFGIFIIVSLKQYKS